MTLELTRDVDGNWTTTINGTSYRTVTINLGTDALHARYAFLKLLAWFDDSAVPVTKVLVENQNDIEIAK